MNDQILFQKRKLTVYANRVTAGESTLHLSNIESLGIDQRRPFLWPGIIILVSTIPVAFVVLMGAQLLGKDPIIPLLLILIPAFGCSIFSILYRVYILSVTSNGTQIPILKSKQLTGPESAKAVIEAAKRQGNV